MGREVKKKRKVVRSYVRVMTVLSPEIQAWFVDSGIDKQAISECTAHCWLGELGWKYGNRRMGCISMAMNMKTWWNINVHLLSDSGKMKGASTFGVMYAQFLVRIGTNS